ncbi:hypothetical protein [Prevotella sp. OH937_COT-195]|uniref:hypothetical protein n=1 Tax=Prevotella sp. OH937_COT-195 TaxID=2491051 RepID=UPI001315681E|nr:hypothetical protein [Prevotella sp. OH937_COT-195]
MSHEIAHMVLFYTSATILSAGMKNKSREAGHAGNGKSNGTKNTDDVSKYTHLSV